jgi:oxygen-independent coproporphyrinogen-3 oxidase
MERYYDHEFTYNEYPHKSFWHSPFSQEDVQAALQRMSEHHEVSQLLFLNIPFCKRQCLFCICYTVITQDYGRIQRYLETLLAEIDGVRRFHDERAIRLDIREIHLGGGSPTLLTEPDFDRLVQAMGTITALDQRPRFSLEVDPRGVTPQRLEFYASRGVNRLSFGVQEFDEGVQKAIGRVQPASLLENLLTPQVRSRFDGINFDVLCGLPRQTPQSFQKTVQRTIEFSPDRIMLMFFNYCPGAKAHQWGIDRSELPSLDQKMEMFREAAAALEEAGYVRIGFDHFARPEDDLARAFRERSLHWNSLGYRPGRCVDMVGLGAGSLSRLSDEYYVQNLYDLDAYEKAVQSGQFPVQRGYRLTAEDKLRRDVIHSLRCTFGVDFAAIGRRYHIDFRQFFAESLAALAPCQTDGLVEITDQSLAITDLGKTFTSHICGVFDAYIPKRSPSPCSTAAF